MKKESTLKKESTIAAKVKELSHDFTPREIAEKLGIAYNTVTCVQVDPRYNIQNPKRAYGVYNRKPRTETKEGFFDCDTLDKMFI